MLSVINTRRTVDGSLSTKLRKALPRASTADNAMANASKWTAARNH
jgi:hypothetical protein